MTDRPSPQSFEILRTLIAFDTTSRNSNLALINYVKSYLDDLSVPYRLTYDDNREKANLLAIAGPADKAGGYVLSGHTDVVPVDGQNWTTDPFEMTEVGDRLYGRGTTDMKSYLAVVLASLPQFLQRGLEKPLYISMSYDEERGLLGVRRLIADMVENGIKPDGCFVGEPTRMAVITEHKGKRAYRCHVHGRAVHSSQAPSGVSAIEYAGELVAFIRSVSRDIQQNGPFDDGYDCPHTSVNVGLMQGGTSLNIVPADCEFEFEFRHLPTHDPDQIFKKIQDFAEHELLPQMQTIDPQATISFDPFLVVPTMATDADAKVAQLAKAITGVKNFTKASYNCEACLFEQAGVPSVTCGPGDIAQAHKPNEFIEIGQITECESFMQRLMQQVCVSR